ncbi:hypothetical protein PS3A_43140 [Pseudomonas sp. 3A(2025)]
MKRPSLFIAPALCLVLCTSVQAEIYKCVSAQGAVSYSSISCPQATVQRAGPPLAMPDMPRDHVHKVNLQAIQNLKVSGKANTYVIEGEGYKQVQRNRLPPPTVPSQCVSPRYDSQCFDPSGGQSSINAARRKNAAGLPEGASHR